MTAVLSDYIKQKVDHALTKYPKEQRRSAVKSALMYAQEENGGWLTTELMDAVAEYLRIPKIAVYEVATFYTMFELQPVGKHKVCVCTNISCQLRGAEKIANHLKQKLDTDWNETTADGKFTLKEVECLGACCGAPMMQINKDYHENLTPEKVDQLLAELD